MSDKGPIKGVSDWLVHQLTDNYWFATLVATISAPCIAGGLIFADRHGAASWVARNILPDSISAGAAQQFATTVVGVGAAVITLYLSATLIVLTLAAGALGVRLVEYWLGKRSIRFSLALFGFNLVYALTVLAFTDDKAATIDLPLLSLTVMALLQLAVVITLAVTLQDLGRTSLIDKSIGQLGLEAGGMTVALDGAPVQDIEWQFTLSATRAGYVEGIDLDEIAEHLSEDVRHARIAAAPGSFVLKGQPLLLLDRKPEDPSRFHRYFAIGRWRSSAQAAVFHIRLLVEMALRAMSPAVNDLYTARACADWLAFALDGHADNWVEEGERVVYAGDPRLEMPGQDLAGLFAAPLHAFRQSAASYPSIATRMIGHYARLAARADAPSLAQFYRREARDLAEHAAAQAEYSRDRHTIEEAFAQFDDPPTSAIA